MQKVLIFSLGFLVGLIACWDLQTTVARKDLFEIKKSIEQYRDDIVRTTSKIEECQTENKQIKHEMLETISAFCIRGDSNDK